MQFECSARRLAVVALSLSGLLAPVLLVAFVVLAFMNHGANNQGHGAHGLMLVGLGTAPALTAAPNSQANVNALLSRITRDQGPEVEQSLNFANTTQLSTPTSLRTDRKVKFFTLHMRGRITNSGTPGTYRTAGGVTLLGTPLFSLIQQVTIRGQHLRYGAQVPFQMRGEAIAEYLAITYPNYVPCFSISVNGGALTKSAALVNTASATQDFDFVLPIPLFPPDIASGDQPFYCLHGPDWPGNLYMDVQTADVTALGVTLVQGGTNLTAFGSASGSATIEINSERPLISKDFMSKIRPAVLFRTTNFQQPTAAVSGTSGSGLKLADLIVGKDTTRIFVKAGVQLAATTAGIVVFGSLSDTILTRTFFAMDNRNLRFHGPNGDSVMQDYMGRMYGRTIPAGYRMIDFVSGTGSSSTANPKSSFSSSKLTSARKFEVDADVTAAANQIAEVTQEILLGRPAMLA